jgi:Tfp pilus assembly pilus retraction ATPase PilT
VDQGFVRRRASSTMSQHRLVGAARIQVGRSQGNQTFDEALKDLVRRELITPETAYMAALKKEDFEPLVSAEFLRKGGA